MADQPRDHIRDFCFISCAAQTCVDNYGSVTDSVAPALREVALAGTSHVFFIQVGVSR